MAVKVGERRLLPPMRMRQMERKLRLKDMIVEGESGWLECALALLRDVVQVGSAMSFDVAGWMKSMAGDSVGR